MLGAGPSYTSSHRHISDICRFGVRKAVRIRGDPRSNTMRGPALWPVFPILFLIRHRVSSRNERKRHFTHRRVSELVERLRPSAISCVYGATRLRRFLNRSNGV
jgi:hypothetical protein